MMQGSNSLEGPVLRSGGPAYQQISEVLTDEIFRQVWEIGEPLPNEKKLSDRFRVSIGTVRRAIESLEQLGLVSKKQGLGTFVTAKATPPARIYEQAEPFQLNAHFAANAEQADIKTELISLESMPADESEARALGIDIGDLIWLIEVRHMLNTQLVAYEQLCISRKLFPKLNIGMLQNSGGNLYKLVSEVLQVRIGQVTDEVTVRSMEPRIASLFNKIPEAPSLRVFRITHSMDNKPIEKREVWLDPSYAHYKGRLELS